MSVSRAGWNVTRVAWNQAARLARRAWRWGRRGAKQVREVRKGAVGQLRGASELSRDSSRAAYVATVRTARYWDRLRAQTLPRVGRDVAVRRELRAAAAGSAPIVVGPWLGEVGYEALYWVPFVRWFVRHYRVDPARVVVVSRGGVASWYADLADGYVELLDLFSPEEFARRNAERHARGDQKQSRMSDFDREILERVVERLGISNARVCHPSAMFRLLGPFWLGNESLQYALDYLAFQRVDPPVDLALPPLPPRFAAAKFYSGRALPDTPTTREAVHALVSRVAAEMPVVLLDTGLSLDEHEDIRVQGDRVISLGPHLEPRVNLGLQTAVIARASLFVGTCGSLAWLAPMLGTKTIAVYEDDHLLGPHLYAARYAYRQLNDAVFTTLDLNARATIGSGAPTLA